MSATISLAKQESTGAIQHIYDVNKEQDPTFICVGCGKEMIPVKSKARKRDWHFRHKMESECNGGRDTALHDYAVQLLMEGKEIVLAKNLKINYSNPRKEVKLFGKRSDVTFTHNNTDVHCEVYVTHDLDDEKVNLYKTNKIKSVRIDLSEKKWLGASADELKEVVCCSFKNKTLIYWNDPIPDKTDSEFDISGILKGIGIFLGFVLLLRFLCKRKGR